MLAVAAVLWLAFPAPARAQKEPRAKAICAQAGEIVKQLAEISGMQPRRPVPCDFITKEEVN